MAHRLEELLVAQLQLRKHERENRHHLFEIERAIEELSCGYQCSHSDTVERWVYHLLHDQAVTA